MNPRSFFGSRCSCTLPPSKFTPSTLGPAATSYKLIASTTAGVEKSSTTVTTTSGNYTVVGGGSTDITVAGVNYNGQGPLATIASALAIPLIYTLQSTYNTNGTYTVATGVSKIAAYVIGAGGAGGAGGLGVNGNAAGGGGGGGGSGAIVGFKDFTVTPGQTVTITCSPLVT